ncbi:NAC domain-containing protein 7 [Sesbania bispinosa]|nr:NAC domain-containing protein 7 [Sesbania bispinosa]
MQEEGWVVCRAFRKPSPSHRQGFDPWCSSSNQLPQAYFRDQRPLSITDMLHPSPELGTSSHPLISSDFLSNHQSTTLIMDNNIIHHKQQLIHDLPHLADDTPTTHLTNEDCSDEIRSNNSSGQGGGIIDWKSLDNLFAPQFTDDTSNYFSHPPMTMMIPHNHEPQNQPNHHMLGCFPHSS